MGPPMSSGWSARRLFFTSRFGPRSRESRVRKDPAATAGLAPGDTITSIGGMEIARGLAGSNVPFLSLNGRRPWRCQPNGWTMGA